MRNECNTTLFTDRMHSRHLLNSTQLNFIYRALSRPQVEPKCCTKWI